MTAGHAPTTSGPGGRGWGGEWVGWGAGGATRTGRTSDPVTGAQVGEAGRRGDAEAPIWTPPRGARRGSTPPRASANPGNGAPGPQAWSGSRCRGCRARSRPAKLLATPPSFRSSSLAALADSAAACADAAASAAVAAMDADADAGGTGVAAVGGVAIADELTCIHCTRPVAPSTHVKGHIISRGTYLIQWQFGDSGECIPFADLDSRHC